MSKKPLENCKKLKSAKKKSQYIIAKEQKTQFFYKKSAKKQAQKPVG